jgi:hypothetical protein
MKIGEAHQTQSFSLYSANTIGAPMYPAPIGVADRTRKKNYWLTVPGEHCLLALRCPLRHQLMLCGGIIEILKRGGPNISVRLTYFQDNHLLTGHYKQETEILLRKDDDNIKK